MWNLIKRLSGRYRLFLTLTAILLSGFQYLICAVVSTVNITDAFSDLMSRIPEFMRTLVEQEFFGTLNPGGILAFGWNHPISQALGTATAIVLASRAVAGEIEGGHMEFILSHPISRGQYLAGQVLFALLILGILSIVGVGGTLLGQHLFDLELFGVVPLVKLALNYFLLQCAWYGITLLFSVFGREAGIVATIGFLLAVVSYIVQVIGHLWTRASFLLPYSLHTYYAPQTVLNENTMQGTSLLVLTVVCITTVAAAAGYFYRKDIQ